MKKILQKHFGFTDSKIKKMNGYCNSNYLIESSGEKYIFKMYPKDAQTQDLVVAENDTLVFLQNPKQEAYPSPVLFLDGSAVKNIEVGGKEMIGRMLSFLEGHFLGDVIHSKELFKSFGAFLAEMNLKLQSFSHYTIQARQLEWDIQYLNLNKKYISDIPSAKDRNIVSYFFQQFEQNVLPVLPTLRKSIIHNDANEWNVLVNENKVSGIIDFGDLAYSPLINELAVAITYACYDKENPLEWAIDILRSYNKICISVSFPNYSYLRGNSIR